MKRVGSVALLMAGILTAAFGWAAETPSSVHWEFAGWYGGGFYTNVAFDPRVENRVYLTSDVAGVWRSDDLGENWRFVTRDLGNLEVSVMVVAPSDSNVLYAGTSGGLFYSLDAGANWIASDTALRQLAFARPESYDSIAVSPLDPAVVAVGTARGHVFFSRDHGRHWGLLGFRKRPFVLKEAVPALAFSSDARSLWVGGIGGLLRYDFAGAWFPGGGWQAFPNGPSRVTDFFIPPWDPATLYAAGGREVWITRDEGKTWKKTSPIPQGIATRVTAARENGETVLWAVWWVEGTWNGGVVASRNEGKTWTRRDKRFFDAVSNPTRKWATKTPRTNALRVSPHDPGVMFRTDWWGVFRSDDAGRTWREKIRGAPNTVGSDIRFGPDGSLYVATMDNGLLRSRDGGKSYEPLFPVGRWERAKNGHVWRVLILDAEGRRILATSSPFAEDVNQVIRSSDGGRTFELVRHGLPSKRPRKNTMWPMGYPKALAFHPDHPEVVYLGIDGDDEGGLFISRDGGGTWSRSPAQPASRRIYNGLAVDPVEPSRLYWGAFGENGGVYLSENGGKSWRKVLGAVTKVIDIAAASDGSVYAAAGGDGPELWVSRDRGLQWSFLKRFEEKGTACEALAIHPTRAETLAVSTIRWGHSAGGQIYLTRDSGGSWEDVTGDLPYGTGAAAMAFDPGGEWLYLSRYAGSVYRTRIRP